LNICPKKGFAKLFPKSAFVKTEHREENVPIVPTKSIIIVITAKRQIMPMPGRWGRFPIGLRGL
jgi:putative SOS response-associated peptidase YedK